MSTREKVTIRVINLVIIFAIVWIFWYWHSLIVSQRNTATSNLFGDSFLTLSELNQHALKLIEKFLHQPLPKEKVLFVGDVMLGRGVDKLRLKHGEDYFLKKIYPSLHQIDFSVGNLEGPIVGNVPKLSSRSMIFAFSTSSINILDLGKFKLLSLANNHTLDMRKRGLEETRKILRQRNTIPFGDPLDCSSRFSSQKDNIIFMGFNRISDYPCPTKKIERTIASVRKNNPDKFIVVFIHWGKEYSPMTTVGQRKLAHQIIDAGSNLIIGSHPHVIEGIEEYKGKIIFYSLGNFIFDQYFTKAVQESLGVETILYPKMVLFRLWPMNSASSQLFFIKGKRKDEFFSRLSQISDSKLASQIKNGIIMLRHESK